MRSALAATLFVCTGLSVLAQGPREPGPPTEIKSRYKKFEFSWDPQSFFQQLKNLQMAPGTNPAPALDPNKLKADWSKIFANLKDKNIADFIRQAPPPHIPPPAGIEPKAAVEPDERFIEFLQNLIGRAENSDWGELLQESPAWQQTTEELRNLLNEMRSRPADMAKEPWWAERLKIDWDLDWARKHLERLREVPLPRSKVRISFPRVRDWRLPTFGTPSWRGFGDGANIQVLGWVVLIAAMAFLAWRWRGSTKESRAARTLGPWPVAPDRVRTRAELIQAFDYLAVLTLGDAARFENHRRVATRLGQDDTKRLAAQRLAHIYEVARYTPGEGPLSEPERALATQDLCLLAK